MSNRQKEDGTLCFESQRQCSHSLLTYMYSLRGLTRP